MSIRCDHCQEELTEARAVEDSVFCSCGGKFKAQIDTPSPAKFTDEQIEQAIRLLNYGNGLVPSELKKCAQIITQQREQIAELTNEKRTLNDGWHNQIQITERLELELAELKAERDKWNDACLYWEERAKKNEPDPS